METNLDFEREKIETGLQHLGFTMNDARVYISLIVLGPSIPAKIAEDSQVDRSRVYDSLRRLTKKGYVEEEPIKRGPYYKAKNPIEIFSALRKEFREKITLSASLEKLLENYHPPMKQPFLVSLSGKDPIYREILSIIENAEEFLKFIITPDISKNPENFKEISDLLVNKKRTIPSIKVEVALNLEEENYQFQLKKLYSHDIMIYKWDIGNVFPFGLYLSEKSYVFTTLSIGKTPEYSIGLTVENAVPRMMDGFKHLFEWNYLSYYQKGYMIRTKKIEDFKDS
ncbi:MAG: TrmB family transcriptional regulator [Candidatus Lokiarchaeota archaeon]|nr:TrmB family transcriptional regulator [Candidatus Lokiarchaeota archaeon]